MKEKMLLLNIIILFVCTSFNFSDASFVNGLSKCSMKDSNCLRLLFEKIIHEYGKPGIPELNLAPLDPMEVKNISVPILEEFSFTVLSGVITGISDCTINNLQLTLEIDKKSETYEVTCDLIIQGESSLSGSGNTVQASFGKLTLQSQGLAKLMIEKIHFYYDVSIKLFKKGDGLIYKKILTDNVKYKFDVQNVSLGANNFLFGNTDISQTIAEYFNNNWRQIVDNVGGQFLSRGMDHYFVQANDLFMGVPTSAYILEDLSPYL